MMIPLLSSSSSSPTTPKSSLSPRRRASPHGVRSASNRKAVDPEDPNISEKDKPRSSYSAGQAFFLATICSAMTAAVTALMVSNLLSSKSFDMYSDHVVSSTTRSVVSRRRVRTADALERHFEEPHGTVTLSKGASRLASIVTAVTAPPKVEETKFPLSTLPASLTDLNGPRPHVAWLMSFPNRYVHWLTAS